MRRRRTKGPVPVPSFTVRNERDLVALRYWFRRLPEFTSADDDGKDQVVVTKRGKTVAKIVVDDKRLRYGAECIGTYCLIQREDGWERIP